MKRNCGRVTDRGEEAWSVNREPMDKNLYELPPEEHAKIPQMPGSLEEALNHLEKDHAFLLKGDVFTSDFLDMWISHKHKEHDAIRLRPHPYEFHLYYDV